MDMAFIGSAFIMYRWWVLFQNTVHSFIHIKCSSAKQALKMLTQSTVCDIQSMLVINAGAMSGLEWKTPARLLISARFPLSPTLSPPPWGAKRSWLHDSMDTVNTHTWQMTPKVIGQSQDTKSVRSTKHTLWKIRRKLYNNTGCAVHPAQVKSECEATLLTGWHYELKKKIMWKLDAFVYIRQSQWKKKEKITFFPAHAILHSLSQTCHILSWSIIIRVSFITSRDQLLLLLSLWNV